MADHDEIDDYFMHFKDHRLKTFKNWPFEDGSCCAEKLADAGFYHIATDQSPDATRCFACYKELDGWEPNDDPWHEHKKHSPSCAFLKMGMAVEEMTVQELMKLEIKRQACKMTKAVDAKIKEFELQCEEVRKEMKALL
ncbi:baculoviral IAP repeat-containing protein 5-like [Pomacea canaliculata]|uniref:baculoviral IAP repeat-containing protein 5-like n=1 Tax=Pomacea canaliculata TaxID=400727 RepID=UPI000D73BF87|nr:baculoviral IAP repeat-containing protein 5-like [Pomacea canaliculata]